MVPRKGRTDLHGDHFFPFLLPLPNIRTQAVRPGDQRRLRCELLGGIGAPLLLLHRRDRHALNSRPLPH